MNSIFNIILLELRDAVRTLQTFLKKSLTKNFTFCIRNDIVNFFKTKFSHFLQRVPLLHHFSLFYLL